MVVVQYDDANCHNEEHRKKGRVEFEKVIETPPVQIDNHSHHVVHFGDLPTEPCFKVGFQEIVVILTKDSVLHQKQRNFNFLIGSDKLAVFVGKAGAVKNELQRENVQVLRTVEEEGNVKAY